MRVLTALDAKTCGLSGLSNNIWSLPNCYWTLCFNHHKMENHVTPYTGLEVMRNFTIMLPSLYHDFLFWFPWFYHDFTMISPWFYHDCSIILPGFHHVFTMIGPCFLALLGLPGFSLRARSIQMGPNREEDGRDESLVPEGRKSFVPRPFRVTWG
jgi:hypothetical protein